MFIIGFILGFVVCSFLCIDMLKRNRLMDSDGKIMDAKRDDKGSL